MLANTCELGSLKDGFIRDHLVCGIGDDSVRKKASPGTEINPGLMS